MTTTTSTTEMSAHILLPTLIDGIAREEPEAVFLEHPVSETDCKNSFNSVTYAQLSNAINGVAQHLLKTIGPGKNYDTLAYLGPNDARYIFAFVAAIKTGYKLFLTSPRNSSAAHTSLFAELKCDKILTTDPALPSLQNVLAETSVKVLHIATLTELLSTQYEHVPYDKTFETAKDDEVWACDTSGTTGLPKARVYTNSFNAGIVSNITLPPPSGYTSLFGSMAHNKALLPLPLFHPAGVVSGILGAVYIRTIIVLAPSAVPPSVDGLLEMLEHTTADRAIMPSVIMEPLAKNEAQLDRVASKLSMIVFVGGSLPQPLGDVIASKIKLCSSLGSSETGPYPNIFPEGFDYVRDWNYLNIQSAAGVEFESQAENTFELVVKHSAIAAPYQPVFEMFPGLQESDDFIVFLNGEKTNPITFEAQVTLHLDVSTAIVFGKQRWEAGLLIELREKKPLDVAERARMIERLWPTIQRANQDAPAHARIAPSHIPFVEPDMPLQRTSKDTVRRQISLDQYRDKIDRLYADADAMKPSTYDDDNGETISDLDSVVRCIQKEFRKVSGGTEPFYYPETYFFSRGIDSLQVIRAVRQLRQRLSTNHIQPSVVYAHPTPRSLAEAVGRLRFDEQSSQAEKDDNRRRRIEHSIERHTSLLDRILESRRTDNPVDDTNSTRSPEKMVAILTGSTGNIGSYILKSLMSRPEMSHIYCLNRSPDSGTKQKLRNAEVDSTLPIIFDQDRVTFLEVDPSKPNLGLTDQQYQTLVQDVTVIFHNAWPVNFNLPLHSFEPHIEGVVRLCELSSIGAHQPTLVFLSSISAVLDGASKPASSGEWVPEVVPADVLCSIPAGYAESKYIAECILDYAAARHNLPVKIARVGQVSSPVKSARTWKLDEWFPSLILGSRSMGCLSSTLGYFAETTEDINWIPVDVLADTLIGIGLDPPQSSTSSSRENHVFQLLNPHSKAWSELAPAVQEVLPDIRIVSNEDWLDALRKSRDAVQKVSASINNDIEVDKILADNSALRLYDFY